MRIALALMILTVLAGVGPVLYGHAYLIQEPSGSDLTDQDLPFLHVLGQSLARGQLPVWEPKMGCGFPLFAEGQVGALFPFNWVSACLPAAWAFGVILLLDALVGALGTYLFARTLGASPRAAALAGMTFPLSGFFTRHLGNLAVVSSASLIPLLLHLVARAVRSGRPAHFALVAVAFAFQLFTGHLQMPYYAGALVVLAVVFRGPLLGDTGALRSSRVFIATALALALGAGIAGIRVLPGAELWGLSRRAVPLEPGELMVGVPSLSDLAQLVDPWIAGDPSRLTFDFARMGGTFILFHVGLVPLFLALGALVREPRRAWPWLGVALLSVVCATGARYGLTAALSWIPGWRTFRMHGKALLVAELALALLAARGLDLFAALMPSRWVWVLLGVQAVNLVAYRHDALPTMPAGQLPGASPTADFLKSAAPGRVYAFFREDQWLRVYVANRGWRGDPEPFRRHLSLLYAGPNLLHGIESAACYAGGIPAAMTRYADALVPARLYTNGEPGRLGPRIVQLLRVMGVRWVLSAVPLPDEGLSLAYDSGDALDPCRVRVYENPRACARVRLVGGAQVAPDDRTALPRLADPKFDPSRDVVLFDGTAAAGAPGTARLVGESPLALDVDVDGTGGWLVVNDTWYPGWVATLDGRPAPILRANLMFRAVRVPPGAHRVAMRFEPASVRRGAWITIACGLTALALLLL